MHVTSELWIVGDEHLSSSAKRVSFFQQSSIFPGLQINPIRHVDHLSQRQ